VRRVEKDGFIQVDRMGGIPEKVLPALKLKVRTTEGTWVTGVFGNKAHHATSADEKYKVDVVTSLFIDVGASSAEEVHEMGIQIGCPAIYEPSFMALGKDKVCGTALDNRGGLAALIKAAQTVKESGVRPTCDTYFVGTVWEEFNIRGAVFAARKVKADIAICLDVILAGDTADLASRYENRLGDGPSVNFYNFHGRGTLNGTIAHEGLSKLAIKTAEDEGIPFQRFASLGMLTDLAYVQMENQGIACLDMGFPARYTHTPVEMCSVSDITGLGVLLAKMICNIKADFNVNRY
ncbi:MAG: M20/M25/M40 family metallo-hydrolase, partial [Christensenellaceae bacterium]|nr:M20/M25/M40 family metallo-hydrolase [Christensenellaceae bacterium]